MSDAAQEPAAPRVLRVLSLLLALVTFVAAFVGNAIPLYGVLYWQWDTFQLLMLYWMETAVMALFAAGALERFPNRLSLLTLAANTSIPPSP